MDPGYFDTVRKQNPLEKANLLSKLTFFYMREVFQKGWRGELTVADVYRSMSEYKSSPNGDELGVKWKQELKKQDKGHKPSLLRACIKIHGLKFMTGITLYALFDTAVRLSVPLCLEGLINYFSPLHAGVSTEHAYLYAAGVVGFMAITACTIHPMILWQQFMSLKVRVSTASLIYRKILRLDNLAGGKATEGIAAHAINLLTTDVHRIELAAVFLGDLVSTPIESTLVVYLMYRQIGVATFAGVAFLLAFIPLQGYLGKLTGKYRRKTAIRSDERVKLMNEVIQSIEAIKMNVWEEAFAKIIGEARNKEMKVIRKMQWLRAVSISCVKLNVKVAILLSIITYIAAGNELTAAKVFVIFTYYDFLKSKLVDCLPQSITYSLEAYVSFQRMQEFLLLPEIRHEEVDLWKIDEEKEPLNSNGVFEKNGQQAYINYESNLQPKPQLLISMKDYTAYWRNADDESIDRKVMALGDINLNIKAGTLTAVVGSVGSGKSTLLAAMLRELAPSRGALHRNGTIAYAAQDPWLFEASVRQNILFGEELDLRRYKQVIKCCQLQSDLEILPYGDRTNVGERGASLSGGQRARISLARAVYQAADVYLLDDPLAAVDSKVSAAIFEECIRGFLREHAVVLVTHRVHYANYAQNVVVMELGTIVAQGTYNELTSVPEFAKLVELTEKKEKGKEIEYKDEEKIARELSRNKLRSQRSLQRSKSESSQQSFNLDQGAEQPEYEGEVQAKGTVGSYVYKSYIKAGANNLTIFIMFLLFVLAQLFYSSMDVWLKNWVNMEEANSILRASSETNNTQGNYTEEEIFRYIPSNHFHLSREQCLYVYASLIAICIFFTWNKLVVFYNTCIKASVTLHETMYRGVTRAPMWFFHHNPSGRILNRFSKDMGQVDTLLPVALVDCIGLLLEIAAILVVVCLVRWWLIVPTGCAVTAMLLIRTIYIRSSLDLRRIEAISRSQSLNHLSATVSGLSTIRSMRKQRTLAREFDKQLDLHSSARMVMVTANRTFGFWMDIMCCMYLTCVASSFFIFFGDESTGGAVGLAITQVISLVGICQYGMRQTAEVENQMTSVERILEYTNLPAEEPMECDEKALRTKHPDLDIDRWPAKGEIIFKNVSLEYERPPGSGVVTSPAYAIRDVSFTVRGGEKVAVVGRTGAGKSSLLNALFRLSKTTGSITVDGVSANEMGLRRWRGRLMALPQRAALFAASLRANLDPAEQYSDAQIYAALEQVELGGMVARLPAGLAARVGCGGGALSHGQRQLVCLARAALHAASVLLLDEATANVDTDTDKHIQATIRNKFTRATVLTVAHRLHTVMDYDRVIVMDKGRVVESGHPWELLTRSQSMTPKANTQTPRVIPESNEMEQAQEEYGPHVPTSNRTRSSSSRSECSEAEVGNVGVFKALVAQTGTQTAAALYTLAEQSYKKLQETKKTS